MEHENVDLGSQPKFESLKPNLNDSFSIRYPGVEPHHNNVPQLSQISLEYQNSVFNPQESDLLNSLGPGYHLQMRSNCPESTGIKNESRDLVFISSPMGGNQADTGFKDGGKIVKNFHKVTEVNSGSFKIWEFSAKLVKKQTQPASYFFNFDDIGQNFYGQLPPDKIQISLPASFVLFNSFAWSEIPTLELPNQNPQQDALEPKANDELKNMDQNVFKKQLIDDEDQMIQLHSSPFDKLSKRGHSVYSYRGSQLKNQFDLGNWVQIQNRQMVDQIVAGFGKFLTAIDCGENGELGFRYSECEVENKKLVIPMAKFDIQWIEYKTEPKYFKRRLPMGDYSDKSLYNMGSETSSQIIRPSRFSEKLNYLKRAYQLIRKHKIVKLKMLRDVATNGTAKIQANHMFPELVRSVLKPGHESAWNFMTTSDFCRIIIALYSFSELSKDDHERFLEIIFDTMETRWGWKTLAYVRAVMWSENIKNELFIKRTLTYVSKYTIFTKEDILEMRKCHQDFLKNKEKQQEHKSENQLEKESKGKPGRHEKPKGDEKPSESDPTVPLTETFLRHMAKVPNFRDRLVSAMDQTKESDFLKIMIDGLIEFVIGDVNSAVKIKKEAGDVVPVTAMEIEDADCDLDSPQSNQLRKCFPERMVSCQLDTLYGRFLVENMDKPKQAKNESKSKPKKQPNDPQVLMPEVQPAPVIQIREATTENQVDRKVKGLKRVWTVGQLRVAFKFCKDKLMGQKTQNSNTQDPANINGTPMSMADFLDKAQQEGVIPLGLLNDLKQRWGNF